MRLALLLPLLAGCGVDGLATNGELGRLSFSVVSDWYLDPTELTDVAIVTGHAQSIGVTLTSDGERRAGRDADELKYAMEPTDGVAIEQGDPGDDDEDHPSPPWLRVTVSAPGEYLLSAGLDGEEFDRIHLVFDEPAALDLALYTRAPWGEEFERVEGEGATQVREGTQLAWLPIPLAAGGERLAGDVATDLSADPEELVVPAGNVTHVNEDYVTGGTEVPSLYFIEPGDVTVTVADTVGPGAGSHAFTVVGG